ncbi:hypothetical protein ACOME3_005716 [Neoechinorhynchus agilis]
MMSDTKRRVSQLAIASAAVEKAESDEIAPEELIAPVEEQVEEKVTSEKKSDVIIKENTECSDVADRYSTDFYFRHFVKSEAHKEYSKKRKEAQNRAEVNREYRAKLSDPLFNRQDFSSTTFRDIIHYHGKRKDLKQILVDDAVGRGNVEGSPSGSVTDEFDELVVNPNGEIQMNMFAGKSICSTPKIDNADRMKPIADGSTTRFDLLSI